MMSLAPVVNRFGWSRVLPMRGNAVSAVYPNEVPSVDVGVEDVTPRDGRSTDASKLSFPLQLMLGAICTTAILIGAFLGHHLRAALGRARRADPYGDAS